VVAVVDHGIVQTAVYLVVLAVVLLQQAVRQAQELFPKVLGAVNIVAHLQVQRVVAAVHLQLAAIQQLLTLAVLAAQERLTA
jgi:hypothetical protein